MENTETVFGGALQIEIESREKKVKRRAKCDLPFVRHCVMHAPSHTDRQPHSHPRAHANANAVHFD